MTPTRRDSAIIDMHLHLGRLRRDNPDLYDCIDIERALRWAREFDKTPQFRDDFGNERSGGRGESYVRAQALNLSARARGVEQLLGLIRGTTDSARKTVIDVLGGDGLVRRVADFLGVSDVALLTCDASPFMVDQAWAADHPALLQRADRLLQRDGSVDGVLVAYGSHHIAREDRADMAREAYRVLRPGGVLVLHDFAVGSPMDDWFDQVVDRYSSTGHKFEHFTRAEIQGYLAKAGFEYYEVIDMIDPYVALAATAEQAELKLGQYLLDMYGLVKVEHTWAHQANRWVIDRAKEIFRYPTATGSIDAFSVRYDTHATVWCCTVPRMALVGIGRKLR